MAAASSRERNEQCRLSSRRQAVIFLDNVFPVGYNHLMKKPQMAAGHQNPHKTVEVGEKYVKALWGKALRPIIFRVSEHIFSPKSSNEKKSHRVEENLILGPVIVRLPSHSIACSLLPLAVLKLVVAETMFPTKTIACSLLPLAVLKLSLALPVAEIQTIACSLLPLAVLKRKLPQRGRRL